MRTTTTKVQFFKGMTVLSLAFITTFYSIQPAQSGEKSTKANTIQFNGNEIELGEKRVYPGSYINMFRKQKALFYYTSLPSNINVKDRMTGEMVTKPVPTEVVPVAINGEPVLGNERKYDIFDDWEEYNPPVYTGSTADIGTYLFTNLKASFNKLDDGVYRLGVNNLVVNDKGELAYYIHSGIAADYAPWEKAPVIDNSISVAIDKKLTTLLSSKINFEPATNKDGETIHARVSMQNYIVEVKGHKAKLIDLGNNEGC